MIPSKETLLNYLRTVDTGITVTFTKTDGIDRTMKCTLIESLIPPSTIPKQNTKGRSLGPDSTIRVYDLEKAAWRSFRYDSVKEVVVN